ncbi:GGDEF domain-containing protein [Clostridium sp. A1-XYC3]|uniref:GGDEF domain-containing protein n=1 Tax=Clostridium tanneri TaxID=3037988 RepID=A0ABU4JSL2_9CLOT|nr:GGDEF domain-containing protein [Clostridium sp. A1-XYC3]MDW8801108.1 GGDEF domain-containing protein [Clostridium sp. A1-XYC3]
MCNLRGELERILKLGNIKTVFQPIISLKSGNVFGYEALTRGPENSPLKSPEKLFSVAQSYNRLWELECLCRSKAIERGHKIHKNKFLFLNVDPYIFKDDKYKKGFTKEFLSKYNMSPESIIFEITERTCIKDYKSFKLALDNYLEEGYKIAIDDTGAGYSGLKMLSETKPHYIKIDMDLIRDIHKDLFKQHLISGLVSLSNSTNMKLIAEGIECEEELVKLIQLGVHAGQGYFLQRPSETLLDTNEEIKNIILNTYNQENSKLLNCSKISIGQIARRDKTFDLNRPCKDIKEYFDNTTYTGACIVNKDLPVGLVMSHSLNSIFATQYGLAVFLKRPISLIMNTSPLVVDYNTFVSDVSQVAMSRKDENVYDYIIITKNFKYYGVVTIKNLLEFTTALERNYAKELNPLTSLPGNVIIENKLKEVLELKRNSCILYFDIDNFKVYNDSYGFENGDKVLKLTANIIKNNLKIYFSNNNFLGHIGGDDFIAVVEGCYGDCVKLCEKVIKEFDEKILDYFDEEDKKNGFIEAIDRKGNKDTFDITSISIAGVLGMLNVFSKVNDIAKYVANMKKETKSLRYSNYRIKVLSNDDNYL